MRVGYQWAASIANWSLTCKQSTLASMDSILVARVGSIDLFWSTQLPIQIRLWMGSAWWVWDKVHILTPLQYGQTMEAKLEGNPVAMPSRG